MSLDKITYYFTKAFRFFFLYNIVGTSYGVVFGFFLLSLQKMFASFIPIIGLIDWYGFPIFGALLFNIGIIGKQKYEDPMIEKRLKYTRQIIQEANLSDKEKRQLWRDIINSISKELGDNIDVVNTNNDSYDITSE